MGGLVAELKALFIGDVFGDLGRKAVGVLLPGMREEYEADIVLANCENASSKGSGISSNNAKELFESGVDVITMGNHCWRNNDVVALMEDCDRIVRPANYPSESPGTGSVVIETGCGNVGVINVLGRIFMDCVDCPFKAVDREIGALSNLTNIIIIDMHAEASSEKCAMAHYVDGRASFVAGTHTHVQTADERVFPQGTGFITDIGMTGPHDGVIGIDKNVILKKFIRVMPVRFDPAKGRAQFNAVVVDIDDVTGKTIDIVRISKVLTV